MVEGGASKQKRSSPRKTRDKNYPFASIKQVQLYIYAAREVFLLHFHSYDNRPKGTWFHGREWWILSYLPKGLLTVYSRKKGIFNSNIIYYISLPTGKKSAKSILNLSAMFSIIFDLYWHLLQSLIKSINYNPYNSPFQMGSKEFTYRCSSLNVRSG